MSEPVRLSKRLTELLPCSRREAELYIEGGWVAVDGQVVEEPQFKVAEQRIELLPGATPEEVPMVSLLLHKPAGYGIGDGPNSVQRLLSHANHWAEDHSGIRPVKKHLLRQKMIGSLETDTSGLLVFTQNWGVTRHLENANKPLEEEYVAKVSGHLGEGGLEKLKRGLKLPDRQLPPCKVSWQNETHLRFALKAPQPGQIRQMCAAVGLKLLGLRRIRIGAVSMAKLPAGQWRYLLPNERF